MGLTFALTVLAVSVAVGVTGHGPAAAQVVEPTGFSALPDISRGFSGGMWSDGTTMWIMDVKTGEPHAYSLPGGSALDSRDFPTVTGGAVKAWGMWSDGVTLWVLNFTDSLIQAHSLSDGSIDPSRSIGIGAGSHLKAGLWSDGTTIWYADSLHDTLYAYSLSDGTRDSTQDIVLDTDNDLPRGIWSDGTTMWVTNELDTTVFAYSLSDGERDPDQDFQLDQTNANAAGIWSDGVNVWVGDRNTSTVHVYQPDVFKTLRVEYGSSSYSVPEGGSVDVSVTLSGYGSVSLPAALDEENLNARGAWSDGTTIWVVGPGVKKAFAYSLLDGSRRSSKDITLDNANGFASGLWSDGVTLYVSDRAKVYAYALSDGSRDSSKDIRLAFNDQRTGSLGLGGIWGNDLELFVLGQSDGEARLSVYSLTLGVRFLTFSIERAGSVPMSGLWADGTTIWVGGYWIGDGENRLEARAYSMDTFERDESKDFAQSAFSAVGGTQYFAFWSDGDMMWSAEARTLGDTGSLLAAPFRTYREDVTVPVRVSGLLGGASSNDFSGVPASVTFSGGATTSASFTVSATSDDDDDDDESVVLGFKLALPEGFSPAVPRFATVAITDDPADVPDVSVSYGSAAYSVAEGDSVTVTVTLSEAPEREVEVPITATGANGASAADFSVPATVTFDADETSKTFEFSATSDDADDDDETVTLGFGPTLPDGVAAGGTDSATVAITDDPA